MSMVRSRAPGSGATAWLPPVVACLSTATTPPITRPAPCHLNAKFTRWIWPSPCQLSPLALPPPARASAPTARPSRPTQFPATTCRLPANLSGPSSRARWNLSHISSPMSMKISSLASRSPSPAATCATCAIGGRFRYSTRTFSPPSSAANTGTPHPAPLPSSSSSPRACPARPSTKPASPTSASR